MLTFMYLMVTPLQFLSATFLGFPHMDWLILMAYGCYGTAISAFRSARKHEGATFKETSRHLKLETASHPIMGPATTPRMFHLQKTDFISTVDYSIAQRVSFWNNSALKKDAMLLGANALALAYILGWKYLAQSGIIEGEWSSLAMAVVGWWLIRPLFLLGGGMRVILGKEGGIESMDNTYDWVRTAYRINQNRRERKKGKRMLYKRWVNPHD
jgi:hypothetical protein